MRAQEITSFLLLGCFQNSDLEGTLAKQFCANCGEAVDDVAFCQICGTAVQTPSASGSGKTQTIAPPATPPAPISALGYLPRVNRTEALKRFFVNFKNFDGRAVRGEFWYPVIVMGLLSRLVRYAGNQGFIFSVLEITLLLACAVPFVSVGVRRLHDTGRSATFMWLMLLPVAGWAILVFMWLGKSQPFDNQFGPKPE